MTARTLIRVGITIDTRWAVGGLGVASDEIDLPVLVDPRSSLSSGSRAYLPATGLAGSLRRHLTETLGEAATVRWLGVSPLDFGVASGTQDRKKEFKPGPLQFRSVLPIERPVRNSGRTAVDEDRAAADGGSLREEQWVEPAATTVLLQHEGRLDAALLRCLECWSPVVGRGGSIGLGQTTITAVEALTVDLDKADELTWWLTSRASWLQKGDAGAPAPACAEKWPANPEHTMRLAHRSDQRTSWPLVVTEPVHVGRGGTASQRDGREALAWLTSDGTAIVPGSSWKGVFRHRIRLILRARGASEQLIDTVTGDLFGSLEVGRGLLVFHESSTAAKESSLATHVAIDRFTGGARTSALYRVAAIPRGTSLTLTISTRPGRALPDPVANLLEHVVADLHDGLIGVGGQSTRGYGHVSVAPKTIRANLAPVDPQAVVASLNPPKESDE